MALYEQCYIRTKCGTGRNASLYQLWPCSNGQWCCSPGDSGINCCGDSFSLSVGKVIVQTSSIASTYIVTSNPTSSSTYIATSNPTSFSTPFATVSLSLQTNSQLSNTSLGSPKDNSTVIGASVGAVLGLALVVAMVTVMFLRRRIRQLKQIGVMQGPAYVSQSQTNEARLLHEIDGRHRIIELPTQR